MNRPVGDRQLEVLRWSADGCPASEWAEDDNVHKISAAALRSRGLTTITAAGKTWTATITDAGTHYLEHGSYPPDSEPPVTAKRSRHRTPQQLDLGNGASETLAEAKPLVKQLQDQGQITVADPEKSVRAH